MARKTLIDELHLSVFIPPGLRAESDRAVRQALRSVRFTTALRRAIRDVFARSTALRQLTFTLSR
ncbi:MAG: hypothetical protein JNM56_00710 [Planctomycetia bacterium]|nr:hypothetical protein [Planctomycetia bacterium]